jgi:NAD+ kinase
MRLLLYGQRIKSEEEYNFVKEVIQTAESTGSTIILYTQISKELEKYTKEFSGYDIVHANKELDQKQIDIAVTLGGDGTILQAISTLRHSNIPILGINLGRLGFLATVEKKIIYEAMHQLANKEYDIIYKSALALKCNKPLFNNYPYALNDFTLNKRDTSSMITIHAYIDDILLNSYWADGLIISTPTGSTGYSLSCGGPIVFPDSQNFVITPVAPHNLNVRPIVISDAHTIRLEVEGRTDSFMCTLDSRYETITSAHTIEISKADFGIPFIQLHGISFMRTLSEKLYWGHDKRN